MNRMALKFLSNDSRAELFESEFSSPLVGRILRCARGRQAFTESVEGTFQWTAAVQSLSAVTIKSKIAGLTRTSPEAWPQTAGLCSDSTPWALSLDFALSKKPRWLLDMFGMDSAGTPIIKRLFIRMNSEKKRPGPSWVSINPAFLEPRNIAILLDGVEVTTASELNALLKLIGLGDETLANKPITKKPSPSRNAVNLQSLDFNAPTEIGVTTFLPVFHGDFSMQESTIETGTLSDGTPIELRLFRDGYAVAVVRQSYCCNSVTDFLLKRRQKHLEFLSIKLREPNLLLSQRRTPGMREFLKSPEKPFYVMSIHHFSDPRGNISEPQRVAMAEPSLVGITDDPALPPPVEDRLGEMTTLTYPAEAPDSVDKHSFGLVSYYISWANVLAVFQEKQADQVLALEALEIELQHLWYKIYHFAESLSEGLSLGISVPSKFMEECDQHYNCIYNQYENFIRIRPTASTDSIVLRRSLEKTSKLEMIFNELTRYYQSLVGSCRGVMSRSGVSGAGR